MCPPRRCHPHAPKIAALFLANFAKFCFGNTSSIAFRKDLTPCLKIPAAICALFIAPRTLDLAKKSLWQMVSYFYRRQELAPCLKIPAAIANYGLRREHLILPKNPPKGGRVSVSIPLPLCVLVVGNAGVSKMRKCHEALK